ncbi:SH3 domain-containing protein [Helicobacter pylori]|uniref:SH3 domain-containing protein n=1 Tax=Helicobacter pylori TaxID=210 RepID=UPI0029290A52|nr:SH3 domain-containing protein [Helicobacter pylori]MDU9777224.1 SH3 domain-containing protein [Helicobacter pylori]
MKTEMKSFLKLFAQPLLVVLAFMLLYALAHAALGFYAKKDSAPISPNVEKTETERQNGALSPKQEEANATTTATEENPTKDPPLPLETAAQEKETKQKIKQEQEKENKPKQNSVPPVQNNQKTPTTPTIGQKPLEYKVAVSGVNVRAFPSTKGKIIGSLAKDKSVKVLEIQNDWAEIEFSNKTKGYVFLKLLKKAE